MKVGIGLAIAVAVVACGSPTPSATPSEGAVDPLRFATAVDGVTVAVTIATDTAEAGDRIPIRVDVTNIGLGPVTWMSGGCALLGGFGIEGPDIEPQPAGQEWDGVAGLVKFSATTGGASFAGVRPPGLPADALIGCGANLDYDEIDPAETISAEGEWSTWMTDGVPGPPGDYRITYAFPFVGRMPVDALAADNPVHPIELAVPVVVEGEPFTGVASTSAVDAALADGRVADWIGTLSREQLGGADIYLVDGAWRLTIKLTNERSAAVRIDAVTGAVTDVDLPPA